MNERIESYLKLHYCRDYFNTYGETVDDDHYFMYREDIDGLIELIVRECISILMKPEYPMTHPEELSEYNKGWVNGRLLGIEHIKEQFGVE